MENINPEICRSRSCTYLMSTNACIPGHKIQRFTGNHKKKKYVALSKRKMYSNLARTKALPDVSVQSSCDNYNQNGLKYPQEKHFKDLKSCYINTQKCTNFTRDNTLKRNTTVSPDIMENYNRTAYKNKIIFHQKQGQVRNRLNNTFSKSTSCLSNYRCTSKEIIENSLAKLFDDKHEKLKPKNGKTSISFKETPALKIPTMNVKLLSYNHNSSGEYFKCNNCSKTKEDIKLPAATHLKSSVGRTSLHSAIHYLNNNRDFIKCFPANVSLRSSQTLIPRISINQKDKLFTDCYLCNKKVLFCNLSVNTAVSDTTITQNKCNYKPLKHKQGCINLKTLNLHKSELNRRNISKASSAELISKNNEQLDSSTRSNKTLYPHYYPKYPEIFPSINSITSSYLSGKGDSKLSNIAIGKRYKRKPLNYEYIINEKPFRRRHNVGIVKKLKPKIPYSNKSIFAFYANISRPEKSLLMTKYKNCNIFCKDGCSYTSESVFIDQAESVISVKHSLESSAVTCLLKTCQNKSKELGNEIHQGINPISSPIKNWIKRLFFATVNRSYFKTLEHKFASKTLIKYDNDSSISKRSSSLLKQWLYRVTSKPKTDKKSCRIPNEKRLEKVPQKQLLLNKSLQENNIKSKTCDIFQHLCSKSSIPEKDDNYCDKSWMYEYSHNKNATLNCNSPQISDKRDTYSAEYNNIRPIVNDAYRDHKIVHFVLKSPTTNGAKCQKNTFKDKYYIFNPNTSNKYCKSIAGFKDLKSLKKYLCTLVDGTYTISNPSKGVSIKIKLKNKNINVKIPKKIKRECTCQTPISENLQLIERRCNNMKEYTPSNLNKFTNRNRYVCTKSLYLSDNPGKKPYCMKQNETSCKYSKKGHKCRNKSVIVRNGKLKNRRGQIKLTVEKCINNKAKHQNSENEEIRHINYPRVRSQKHCQKICFKSNKLKPCLGTKKKVCYRFENDELRNKDLVLLFNPGIQCKSGICCVNTMYKNNKSNYVPPLITCSLNEVLSGKLCCKHPKLQKDKRYWNDLFENKPSCISKQKKVRLPRGCQRSQNKCLHGKGTIKNNNKNNIKSNIDDLTNVQNVEKNNQINQLKFDKCNKKCRPVKLLQIPINKRDLVQGYELETLISKCQEPVSNEFELCKCQSPVCSAEYKKMLKSLCTNKTSTKSPPCVCGVRCKTERKQMMKERRKELKEVKDQDSNLCHCQSPVCSGEYKKMLERLRIKKNPTKYPPCVCSVRYKKERKHMMKEKRKEELEKLKEKDIDLCHCQSPVCSGEYKKMLERLRIKKTSTKHPRKHMMKEKRKEELEKLKEKDIDLCHCQSPVCSGEYKKMLERLRMKKNPIKSPPCVCGVRCKTEQKHMMKEKRKEELNKLKEKDIDLCHCQSPVCSGEYKKMLERLRIKKNPTKSPPCVCGVRCKSERKHMMKERRKEELKKLKEKDIDLCHCQSPVCSGEYKKMLERVRIKKTSTKSPPCVCGLKCKTEQKHMMKERRKEELRQLKEKDIDLCHCQSPVCSGEYKKMLERLRIKEKPTKSPPCVCGVRCKTEQKHMMKEKRKEELNKLKEKDIYLCHCQSPVCSGEYKKMLERLRIKKNPTKSPPCICGVNCKTEQKHVMKERRKEELRKLKEKDIDLCHCQSPICSGEYKKMLERLSRKKNPVKSPPCVCGVKCKKEQKYKLQEKENEERNKINNEDVEICHCQSPVCAREYKKMLERLSKKKKSTTPPPCVCGAICRKEQKNKLKQQKKEELMKIKNEKQKEKLNKDKEKALKEKKFLQNKNKMKNEIVKTVVISKKKGLKKDKQITQEIQQLQKSGGGDGSLIAKNMIDILKLSFTVGVMPIYYMYNVVKYPIETCHKTKAFVENPKLIVNALVASKVTSTIRQIGRRCFAIKLFKSVCKYFPTASKLTNLKRNLKEQKALKRKRINKKKAMKGVPTKKKKPCFWMHKSCPWFYPIFLGILEALNQVKNIVMWMLAGVVWSPFLVCYLILCYV